MVQNLLSLQITTHWYTLRQHGLEWWSSGGAAVEQWWSSGGAAQLPNFEYVIKYRPGTQNRNADALSRVPEQRRETMQVNADRIMTDGDEPCEQCQGRDPGLVQIRQLKEQQLSEIRYSSSLYMKQLITEWDKILLKNGVLGRLCEESLKFSKLSSHNRKPRMCGGNTTMRCTTRVAKEP